MDWRNSITSHLAEWEVKILTDHKPLIVILKKNHLSNAPPRLQCLFLRLHNYNVESNWIPGKGMIFSDHLSCNVNTEKSNEPTCKGLDIKVHNVFLNASGEKCVSLASEMSKGFSIDTIKPHNYKRLAKTKKWMPKKNLKIIWNYHDELSPSLDGLISEQFHVL